VKLCYAGDRALQLLLFNKEFLVSVSHQLALIMSLQGSGGGMVHGVGSMYIPNPPCARSTTRLNG